MKWNDFLRTLTIRESKSDKDNELQGRTFINNAQAAGFLIVALTMVEMFLIPSGYFKLGSIVATVCMTLVAIILTKYRELFRPSLKSITIGLLSAAALYFVFLGGSVALKDFHVLNSQSNEASIYSLIASGSISIQIVVLLLDALGFESYFRGNLVNYFHFRVGNFAPFLVALVDALIHATTLNPVFVITTFIADSVWGAVYFFTKDLSSSFVSHLIWDLAIFIIFPIR
jgi:membrane protease YdiL (CAAX protease family)